MSSAAIAEPKVLLFGLEDALADELASALGSEPRRLRLEPSLSLEDWLRRAGLGVIFCNADRRQYTLVLHYIRRLRLPVATIVVTRAPETSEWLDALDAGAADYCSPPFEPAQIRWLISSRLNTHYEPAT